MPRPATRAQSRALSGDRLRELRIAAGKPLEALAMATHRTAGSVARWERGEASPPAHVIHDLALVLGVPVAELLEPASAA